ncbi:MAG TPA: hypothetical protein VGX23_18485 [Actinocrinis sp.]|nr:hypothetical protein [Actinocrinis sp.]
MDVSVSATASRSITPTKFANIQPARHVWNPSEEVWKSFRKSKSSAPSMGPTQLPDEPAPGVRSHSASRAAGSEQCLYRLQIELHYAIIAQLGKS